MKKIHLIGLSLLSGVLLSLSWPSNGFAPLIFIALVPLFFVQDTDVMVHVFRNGDMTNVSVEF